MVINQGGIVGIMKTVVVQTLWGHGMFYPDWRSKQGELGMKKYCIPSVRRYADRHGYSYLLHRPDMPHFNFPANKKYGVTHHEFNSSFDRYYAMNGVVGLYERFIYLDLDVYIKPDAPAMPYEKGVWAFHEWQKPYEHNVRRGFADVPDKHQFNNGVLVMDRKGVKSLYDYLCTTKPDPRCTGSQDYFRLWSVKNKVNHLDEVWNYLAFYTRRRDGHFIHYAADKRWIALETSPLYRRPFYWCDSQLAIVYSALKSAERSIRQTRIYGRLRRWKKKR